MRVTGIIAAALMAATVAGCASESYYGPSSSYRSGYTPYQAYSQPRYPTTTYYSSPGYYSAPGPPTGPRHTSTAMPRSRPIRSAAMMATGTISGTIAASTPRRSFRRPEFRRITPHTSSTDSSGMCGPIGRLSTVSASFSASGIAALALAEIGIGLLQMRRDRIVDQ